MTDLIAKGRALHRQGQLDDAEALYLQVLSTEPERTEALLLVALVAFDRGDWPRAQRWAERALSQAPSSPEGLYLLGRIRLRLGDASSAAEAIGRALSLGVAARHEAMLDLAACHAQRKAWPEVLALAKSVLSEAPSELGAWRLAGFACFSLGRDTEGIACFERVLAADAGQAPIWHACSVMHYRAGDPIAAHRCAQRACELAPGNREYAYSLRLAAARAVPDWHFNMVHDEARNAAFAAAIAAVVDSEQLVLEIGGGSGLLALLAARSGARRVVSCEQNPLLAATATENVRRNGLSERIDIVAKLSTALQVGVDLPEKASVLIGEIFSVQVITEGVLPSFEDAKARLLTPNARIIPERAAARGALATGEGLARKVRVTSACGFDLSALNAFMPVVQYLQSAEGVSLLSEAVDLFSFDFANDSVFPSQKREVSLTASVAGRCEGVLQWLRLDLLPGVHFENVPGSAAIADSQHWAPVFYPFERPLELAVGQIVTLRTSHNRSGLRVELAHSQP